MKFLLVLLFLILPLSMGVVVFQAVEDVPRIGETRELTLHDIERAKDIVAVHDPRKLDPGQMATLTVNQDDINLVANYALFRFWGRVTMRVDLDSEFIRIRGTILLPRNPLGGYVNFDAGFWEADPLPQLAYARVGKVSIPRWIVIHALRHGPTMLDMDDALALALESLHRVDVDVRTLSVTYLWRPDLKDKLRAELVSQDDSERLQAYSQYIAELTRMLGAIPKVSLATLLGPIFQFASQRSEIGDPIAENQAAI